jgi:hypothetical protein
MKRKTTVQYSSKVPSVPYRHRHTIHGTHYGIKKPKGKKKDQLLGVAERKAAQPKSKERIEGLSRIDAMRKPRGPVSRGKLTFHPLECDTTWVVKCRDGPMVVRYMA